ncbi:MAG: Fur family transcriptional regulator [Campylobacterota bacterium]
MQANSLTFLKQHNIKATPQRLSILNLLESHGHLSIKEIFERIKPNFPSISLATIYKNINFLLDKSLLKEVKLSNLDSKYEIAKDPHAHLVCTRCGKVEDVEVDISAVMKSVEKNSDFIVEANSLELSGVCQTCS